MILSVKQGRFDHANSFIPDLDQTRALARMLGLRAVYEEGHIDHDVRIAVFDAAGRLVRTFVGWDFDEDQAAEGW